MLCCLGAGRHNGCVAVITSRKTVTASVLGLILAVFRQNMPEGRTHTRTFGKFFQLNFIGN